MAAKPKHSYTVVFQRYDDPNAGQKTITVEATTAGQASNLAKAEMRRQGYKVGSGKRSSKNWNSVSTRRNPAKKASKKRAAKKRTAKRSTRKAAPAKKNTAKRKAAAKRPAKKNGRKTARRRNPGETAAERYKYFHGRDPETVTDIETPVKYHGTLSGIGKLEKLVIESPARRLITLGNFGGALLAQNEKGTQLFISGGNQSVSLKDFGIESQKEKEYLGLCRQVFYHTVKDHLGDDGGDAIYHHKFSRRDPPHVVYDVRNKLLHLVGGKYTLPAEGIKD